MKNFFAGLLVLMLALVTGSCKKEYSLEGGDIKANGIWTFVVDGKVFDGSIDTAYIEINNGTKVLHLQGPSLIGDQKFNLRLYSLNNFQVQGGYTVSASQVDLSLVTPSKSLFQSDALAGELTVGLTTLANNSIAGIFSGAVDDSTGASRNISSGSFSSTIDLQNNTSNNTSVGTLGNSSGVCTPATVAGTYTKGTAMSSGNTVQMQVNVTTPGTYLISTNIVNGVSFAASGTFANTGAQTITLTGSGTPPASGLKTYTVNFGSSTCTFDITYN